MRKIWVIEWNECDEIGEFVMIWFEIDGDFDDDCGNYLGKILVLADI